MPSMLVTDGPACGNCFLLPSERFVSLGRDDQCTFQILDRSVSRKHLQIEFEESTGTRTAADYRSAHGVIINGKSITEPFVLRDGDEIQLGDTTIVYLESDHEDAKSAEEALRKRNEWKRSTVLKLD